MKHALTTILFALAAATAALAQVRVTAEAPAVVAEGEQFRLQYSVNSQDVSHVSGLADMEAFEVLYGPARSSSSYIQIINGKTTQSATTTYTYTLMATKRGNFTLPSLTVTVGGNSYKSNTPQIKVVEGQPDTNAGGRRSSPRAVNVNTSGNISNKDLFITVSASKGEVYEQEPVLLTYKVFTRLDLNQLSGKMPDLKGFLVKEIPLPQQKSLGIEHFNGENYYTTTWSQYVMYPQQTGKLTVPSIKYEGVVTIPDPNIDFLDAFFSHNSGVIRRSKTIMAPSLTINVKPLPDRPDNFSGGVGSFSVKAQVKNSDLKEQETLEVLYTISGTGNMDMLRAPEVAFPKEFDTYKPSITNNSKLSASNTNGSVVVHYLAVPKAKGEYTIPAIPFTYFDPATRSYKTISSEPMAIHVAKGQKNIYNEKQQEILAQSDIRHIHATPATLRPHADTLWGSPVYWAVNGGMLLLFAIVLLWLNRRRSLSANTTMQRSRGADRVASRRLKRAKSLLGSADAKAFAEEIISALAGYVSDKLDIPTADLSKDYLARQLSSAGIAADEIGRFTAVLDQCEFMRYGGGAYSDIKAEMQRVYDEAHSILANIKIKK